MREEPPEELLRLLLDHGVRITRDGNSVLIQGTREDLLEALLHVPPKLSLSNPEIVKKLWKGLGADRPRLR
ncbi:MAG: hypothetical protein ABGY09_03910 [Euryarchaeota archaeon]